MYINNQNQFIIDIFLIYIFIIVKNLRHTAFSKNELIVNIKKKLRDHLYTIYLYDNKFA